MSLIKNIVQDLVDYRNVKPINNKSQQHLIDAFDFVGLRNTGASIDFVAFKECDNLKPTDIFQLHNTYFELIQNIPARGKRILMPNGLLGLTFNSKITAQEAKSFQATRISHSLTNGRIAFSWILDLKQVRIYTHKPQLSWFPPVRVPQDIVFPSEEYLLGFMRREQLSAGLGYQSETNKGHSEIDTVEHIAVTYREIRKFLTDHSSISELHNLAFDLGIDKENFSNLKNEFIPEFLSHVKRTGKGAELLDWLNEHAYIRFRSHFGKRSKIYIA